MIAPLFAKVTAMVTVSPGFPLASPMLMAGPETDVGVAVPPPEVTVGVADAPPTVGVRVSASVAVDEGEGEGTGVLLGEGDGTNVLVGVGTGVCDGLTATVLVAVGRGTV